MKIGLGLATAAIVFSATVAFAHTGSMPSNSGSNASSGATGGMDSPTAVHRHHHSRHALPPTSKGAKEAQPPGSGPTSGR